jgi:hypothetical protein
MQAHSVIENHHGENTAYIRCHMGLEIPEGLPKVGLVVGDQERSWSKGELLAFCDAYAHGAFNHSDRDRYVLIFDIMPPKYGWYTKEYCAFMIALVLTQVIIPGQGMQYGLSLFNWKAFPSRLYFVVGLPLIPIFYFYFRFICKERPKFLEKIRKRGYAFYF